MANKNFEIKNGLTIAGAERISAAGAFNGTISSATTGSTQSASDNSTKLATTAYVTSAVNTLIGGAPGALDTLNELAAAINDDASFASTITSNLAGKLSVTGGTMSGALSVTAAGSSLKGPVYIASQNSTGEGGEISLNGSNGNTSHILDTVNGTFRIFDGSGTLLTGNSGYGLNVISGYRLNGTMVIDSNRNLTSIGTINSGAITVDHTDGTDNISLTPTSTGGVINARDSSGTAVVNIDGRTTQVLVGVTSGSTSQKVIVKTSVDNAVNQGLAIVRSANSDTGYLNYQGGAFRMVATDGDPIRLGHVSNPDRVTIYTDGKLLAGVTSPGVRSAHTLARTGAFAAEMLQQQTSAGASVLGLTYDGAAPNNQTDYFIYAQDTAGIKYRLFSDGSSNQNGGVTANSFRPGTDNRWKMRSNSGNAQLVFEYATSSALADSNIKVKLMDSGRVGIGPNITPAQLFHVSAGSGGGTTVRFGQVFDTNVQIGPVTATASGYTSYLNAAGTSYWSLGYRDAGSGTSGSFRLRRGASLDTAGPLTSWGDDGSMTIATTTQAETATAQLSLTNNVNANPSHVNLKFNTYAWLGMIQCEQRAAAQYGALNFWTANNGNPTQKMCLSYNGNLTLTGASDASQDGYKSKHRKVAVTGSTTVTASSWSASPGNTGGYDVSNDNASVYYGYGGVQAAGFVNRHVLRLALVGNYTANTWYPIATWNQLWDWCITNTPGQAEHDGFSMYFRIYTYDVSAGGSEYLSSRVTDRIWINQYGSNSNQRHPIAIGAASGHAPNLGPTSDHSNYGNNPYQMSILHHYANDSYYPGRQTLEFKFKTARTGLTEAHSAQTCYVYGYLG